MEPDSRQSPKKPPKGYGKRPVWFWVLVYLIVAVIVYGIIYVLFMRDGGSGGGLPY